jgi:hypothetical protein
MADQHLIREEIVRLRPQVEGEIENQIALFAILYGIEAASDLLTRLADTYQQAAAEAAVRRIEPT